MKNVECPCCGYLTFTDPTHNSYDICPVCFWEDDFVQYQDKNYAGGPNKLSLKEARKNFLKFGATEKRFIEHVRKPLPEEISI